MNYNTTIEIELSTRPEPFQLDISVDYEWCNDGIGSYEYWGSVGFDSGTDYIDVSNVTYDKTQFTEQEIAEIELTIDSTVDSIKTEIERNNPKENEDYDECDPYDIEYDR
jgi:hypothetical protein